MSKFLKVAALGAMLTTATAVATPAAAQSSIIGRILDQANRGQYGYGQYPQGNYGYGQTDTRVAVDQCARAVETRLNAQGGYNNGYNNGYDNRYGQNYGGNVRGNARVVGISNVERRNKGSLRVHGLASTGAYAGYNNGYQGQYGQYQGQYGGQYQGQYPNQYGQYQGQYGGQARADLTFSCKVDLRGNVTDLQFQRVR